MDEVDMHYGLRVAVLAKTPFLPLERVEYEALKDAKALLVDALALEESFHLVLANFFEYEAALLERALYSMLYTEGSWSDFVGTIHDINRRVVNLLSGGRGYVDQASHLLSGRFGKGSEQSAMFKAWRSDEYDARLGYRAMEALRNYTQHRGVAVHRLSHSFWRDGIEEDSVRRNAIVPTLDTARLREDGGFKAGVLRELAERGDVVDLRPLIREYVAGLAVVHNKLRDSLKTRVVDADALVSGAIERYRTEAQEDVVGLSAIKRNPAGLQLDAVGLFTDLIERRRDLERRTRRVPSIVGQYTTNEPKRS